MKKRVLLITGSGGLIGLAASSRLAGAFQVIGLDREKPRHAVPGVEYIETDIGSDESVQRALQEVRKRYGENFASVLHLAAYFDFSGEPSPKYDQITVAGTRRLLQGLKTFHLEQFIFSSTMLVHAPCRPGERINEDWPLDPRWPYPESKVNTERLILAERGNIPGVLFRIAGVYDDRCHLLPLAHQIQHIYEHMLISRMFPGDPSRGQAVIHLDDVIGAFALAIERRSHLPPETILLVGEGETLSYGDLQRELGCLIHGKEWQTTRIPTSLAQVGAWFMQKLPFRSEPLVTPRMIPFADDHYALDTSRAHTLLDWEPQNSLRQTLPEMVEALRSDALSWYHENKIEPPAWLKQQAA